MQVYTNNVSKFSLIQIFYDVLDGLRDQRRPRSKWLQWETPIGYLLWGMLLSIKLRKYVEQHAGNITGTRGWTEFEEGRKALQRRILAQVRENGGE